jgi:hypothetical protein
MNRDRSPAKAGVQAAQSADRAPARCEIWDWAPVFAGEQKWGQN